MKDKIFVDSNIILYSISNDEIDKNNISRNYLINSKNYISTQVLNEVANVLLKKHKVNYDIVLMIISELILNNFIIVLESKDIIKALDIQRKYFYSYYDSLIISASIKSQCNILLSEDLNHNQIIEGSLKIVNPFK